MPVGGERCPWATTASTDEAIGRITPARRSFDGAHNEPCQTGRRQLEDARLRIEVDLDQLPDAKAGLGRSRW
jgi:hypothetical protein